MTPSSQQLSCLSICLCAPVTNQSQLFDWIAYHNSIGIEHFYLWNYYNRHGSASLIRFPPGVVFLESTPSVPELIEKARQTGKRVAVFVHESTDEFVVASGANPCLVPGVQSIMKTIESHSMTAGYRTDGGALLIPAICCRLIVGDADWRTATKAVPLPLRQFRRNYYFFGSRSAPKKLPKIGHCTLIFEKDSTDECPDTKTAIVWPPLSPFYCVSKNLVHSEETTATIPAFEVCVQHIARVFFDEPLRLPMYDEQGMDASLFCEEI